MQWGVYDIVLCGGGTLLEYLSDNLLYLGGRIHESPPNFIEISEGFRGG